VWAVAKAVWSGTCVFECVLVSVCVRTAFLVCVFVLFVVASLFLRMCIVWWRVGVAVPR
jgi:hypothetical protein